VGWGDLAQRMGAFSAPVWMKLGLEKEMSHDRGR
jgi:hypothetical protein